jgi:hypothetical protein
MKTGRVSSSNAAFTVAVCVFTVFDSGFHEEPRVLTEMAVFWNVAPCSLVDSDRRFRGAYCMCKSVII